MQAPWRVCGIDAGGPSRILLDAAAIPALLDCRFDAHFFRQGSVQFERCILPNSMRRQAG
jgi:hypothetical protein